MGADKLLRQVCATLTDMSDQWQFFVYILASKRNGTLYIGVTNDLGRRVSEHETNLGSKFTSKYGVHLLVWYETFEDINLAIAFEKRLKGWNRAWKIKLIEARNPDWANLALTLHQ